MAYNFGNRQKSFLKQVFGNKVLNFCPKIVLWKKVLELKSFWSQTIKRLYFLGLIFWFQYDFIQKKIFPKKNSPFCEKCI